MESSKSKYLLIFYDIERSATSQGSKSNCLMGILCKDVANISQSRCPCKQWNNSIIGSHSQSLHQNIDFDLVVKSQPIRFRNG